MGRTRAESRCNASRCLIDIDGFHQSLLHDVKPPDRHCSPRQVRHGRAVRKEKRQVSCPCVIRRVLTSASECAKHRPRLAYCRFTYSTLSLAVKTRPPIRTSSCRKTCHQSGCKRKPTTSPCLPKPSSRRGTMLERPLRPTWRPVNWPQNMAMSKSSGSWTSRKSYATRSTRFCLGTKLCSILVGVLKTLEMQGGKTGIPHSYQEQPRLETVCYASRRSSSPSDI